MKKIRYKILDYTAVFNEKTGEQELHDCMVTVTAAYSLAAIDLANKAAHNGDYEVFDDGAENLSGGAENA